MEIEMESTESINKNIITQDDIVIDLKEERKSGVVHIATLDMMFTSKCNLDCKYCFEDKPQKNMDFDQFKHYMTDGGSLTVMIFGGEPFANIPFLEKYYEYLNNLDMNEYLKSQLLQSSKNIITNGTLLHKPRVENLIKNNDLRLQISLDGHREANDKNRVTKSGKGSFDTVMKNVEEVCKKNKFQYSFHGVLSKDNLPLMKDAVTFLFDLNLKNFGVDVAITNFGQNFMQTVLEQEYTDQDIDLFIQQIHLICEYFMNHSELNYRQKRKLVKNFLTRHGGKCGAGFGLLAVDTDFNIFPCHRQADNKQFNQETQIMGNIFDRENLKNFSTYNSFYHVGLVEKFLYGYNFYNEEYKNGEHWWIDWCPSTNAATSSLNIYYINSKYMIAMLEVSRFCKTLFKHYEI